jgi:hypothetical protein
MASRNRPSWLYPVPVRPSRFLAVARKWAVYNIEVAPGKIAPYCFDRAGVKHPVLFYDFQTHLEQNWPGRLGSGRGGIYRSKYLKGVGRTPAAANWDNPDDRYHGSGHLSVRSALCELLITRFLSARQMSEAIVPCESLLLRPLNRRERRTVRNGGTSSVPNCTAADGVMAALTIKPSDFARHANFVFALNHFSPELREFGSLFLSFEEFLRPPQSRRKIEGSPKDIAEAMSSAFERGLENFRAFARIGLHWVFLQGNVALDGRFLDLETPYFFGRPFIGLRISGSRSGCLRVLLGFEEFGYIRYWRLFLQWMRSRLEMFLAPGVLSRPARGFVHELICAINKQFPHSHDLYIDAELIRQAVQNLRHPIETGFRSLEQLRKLARFALCSRMYDADDPLPEAGWRRLDAQPVPASTIPTHFEVASFLDGRLSADADEFNTLIESLGAHRNVRALLEKLPATSHRILRKNRMKNEKTKGG